MRQVSRAVVGVAAASVGIVVAALVAVPAQALPARGTQAPAVAPAVAVASAGHGFSPGTSGVGDPYFPLEGNGGYDVGHYDLDLSYSPATHQLDATARLTARATQNLSRFDLDFSGMTVRAVTVNGRSATYHRAGQELQVTPRSGLRRGSTFDVAVRYHGSPKTITGSPVQLGSDYGWKYTADGAFVADEPDAARTWFPSNDHPSDKATFTFHVTVPKGKQVVANGDLVSTKTSKNRTTYVWRETSQMATYLATIDIGKFTFRTGTTPGGIPETMAVDPALVSAVTKDKLYEQTAAITDFFGKEFGSYPFTSTGAIVDNAPDIGFSLETQTRPLYALDPDTETISHELSHQWFGDSVSVHSWKDIWLNEGFATFAAALWDEHNGGPTVYVTAKGIFDSIPADDPFWDLSIADPGHDTMFTLPVYGRGGFTLVALRQRIGDRLFFDLLHQWVSSHRSGDASTRQFIALAEKVSGENLHSFFNTWLWKKQKPASLDAG